MYTIKTTIEKLGVEIHQNAVELGMAAAKQAASCMREVIEKRGEVRVVFASAPSQNEFIAALGIQPGIQWQKVVAFHMDEYAGIPPEDPRSFGRYIREKLFDNVNPRLVNYMNGANPDINEECERYAALLTERKPDIICLGIGENGHLAFNDPHEADFEDKKYVKPIILDEKCRQQEKHDFGFERVEDVPRGGITITIPAIMQAENLFIMVPGTRKAEAVKEALTGPVWEKCPASVLRRHDRAVLFLDRDSAALVQNIY